MSGASRGRHFAGCEMRHEPSSAQKPRDSDRGLWETLDGAFPKAIMPDGLAHTLQRKIRKKLRTIGYDTHFSPGVTWEQTVDGFSARGRDRMHEGYGQNLWFWGVAWPAVFGAAAMEFWPRTATPLERRSAAHVATKGHLEELVMAHAMDSAVPVAPVKASAEAVVQNWLEHPVVGCGGAGAPPTLPVVQAEQGGAAAEAAAYIACGAVDRAVPFARERADHAGPTGVRRVLCVVHF